MDQRGVEELERRIRVGIDGDGGCMLHRIRRGVQHDTLARKGAEDGERVLVLGCHVCIEEDDELGEKRGDGQRARGVGRCVGQRGEMPLFWRKVEHDGQMG